MSTMISFKFLILLVAAMIAVCYGQDPSSCKDRPPEMYTLSDRSQSMMTGSIAEENYLLVPESGSWCQDIASRTIRTVDGTCNHPSNLGSTSKPMGSQLPPEYDDGVGTPRVRGEDGEPLPSSREVSLRLHPAVDDLANFPHILMQWGQWLAHDFVGTAGPSGATNCCGRNGGCPPFVSNKECFPVQLPTDDKDFPGVCLHFLRSRPFTNSNTHQPRQQINTVTSFMDCSQIYGSTNDTAAALREPGGFLLRTKNGTFLPESPTAGCIKTLPHHYCFQGGDFRVNQHPYLGAMNTIWVRQHNRIANKLKELKPNSTNEDIFQRARRIVIAQHQSISYNAYLPIILGDDATRWGLTSTTGRSAYNPGLNPSIFTSFSTAAFRFGHSSIASWLPFGDKVLQLRNVFNRPGEVIDNFDGVVAGMAGVANATERSMQKIDRNFVEDVSKFLFMNPDTGKGFDLVTTNIHRGRDHGLAPYTKWRSFCGQRPLTGFNDTEALGPFVGEIGKVYRSVKDVDLYTAMLIEPVLSGLVGPTIKCILRDQFFRTKYGDRFFFDNDEPSIAFTNLQLSQIRATTLATVICLNTNLERLPKNVFRFQSDSNPWVNCSTLKKQDLNLALF